MTAGRADPDAGVATVVACLAMAALLVITGLGVHLGAAAIARHRAEAAADLGALAGAGAVLDGSACARAGDIVVANAATLVSCAENGFEVRVQVQVAVPAVGLGATAVGRARAGPDLTARPP